MAQPQSLDACCTCATLLSSVSRFHPGTEKPLPDDRQLSCCGRVICGNCIYNNPRFDSYCPYCQTPSSSSSSTPVNPRGPKYRPAHHHRAENKNEGDDDDTLPPPYPGPTAFNNPLPPPRGLSSESPPPYTPSATTATQAPSSEQKKQQIPDTIHHLLPSDTLSSLSLQYSIPLPILLSHNNLPLFSLSTSSSPFHSSSSALLFARGRRTISIPGEYNPSGVSLSPYPVESDEEIERKKKIRKWMMTTKVADYDVAVLYMEGNGWDVEKAVEALKDDERWEREHPLRDTGGMKGKGKGTARVGRTWVSGAKRLVPAAAGSGGGNGSVPGGK